MILADDRERRSQRGEYQERHDWAELPPQPEELRRGLCATGGYPPDWWTSHDSADRVAAIKSLRGVPGPRALPGLRTAAAGPRKERLGWPVLQPAPEAGPPA
jgi:hypothetical protein